MTRTDSGYLCCFAKDESCWIVVWHYVNLMFPTFLKKNPKRKINKKHTHTQRKKNQNQNPATKVEPVLRKKRILMSYGIRRYGVSDSNWDQRKSQEQLTLIKLARRCRSGMRCLFLTCVVWNHTFITYGFCSASVTELSLGPKLVCHFCHELNPCLILL